MSLDLSDRRTLLRSWLATLHGTELRFQPSAGGRLAPLSSLLRTALAWHVAYSLFSFGGALVVSRAGSDSPAARAVADAGIVGVIAMTLVLWWGAIGLSSILWWSGVLRARGQRSST